MKSDYLITDTRLLKSQKKKKKGGAGEGYRVP